MNILNKIFISIDITNVEGVQDCKKMVTKWSPHLEQTKEKTVLSWSTRF